jgi:hypothetical protein
MPGDPIKPHHMLGRDIVQRLLALINQRRCHSDGLKRFQCHLTVRAYTDVFLWSVLKLYFMNTGQDSIYLSLENCCISTQRKAAPSFYGLPIDPNPGPLLHLGLISIPDKPLDFRRGS